MSKPNETIAGVLAYNCIHVGPVDFTVKEVAGLHHDNGMSLDGAVDMFETEIHINVAASEQRKVQATWHEIVHAVSDIMALDLDEGQVERIANGIMDVVRRNRELVERTWKL